MLLNKKLRVCFLRELLLWGYKSYILISNGNYIFCFCSSINLLVLRDTSGKRCFVFLGTKQILAKIVTDRVLSSKLPEKTRRSKKRIKTAQVKVHLHPSLSEAFDKRCTDSGVTKTEVLTEYISFFVEHSELGSGREMLEKMLAAYKATSPDGNVH
jgi:hypothetical protein